MKVIVPIVVLVLFGFGVAASAEPPTAPAKPWVTDFRQYLNDHPGHWIVGHSTEPALSSTEAETLARRDAAQTLVDTFASRAPRSTDRRWLEDQIELAIQRDGWITDRYIESKVRPYATIWSASVLINASPARVDALARVIDRGVQQHRARNVAGILGASILVAGVGLAYFLLNWLTRGFFRARLALASLLIVSAGIFGIVHLI